MTARAWLFLALIGCTHTRYVTPWLKTSVHEPLVIYADSNGPKTQTWIEWKRAGRWERVSSDDTALRISDDRALFEYCIDGVCEPVIATARGETIRLPDCHGWIVVPAGHDEIVCVSPRHTGDDWKSDLNPDHTNRPADGSMPVEVVRFDVFGKRHVRAQASLPADALAHDAELQLVGIAEGDPVIAAIAELAPSSYHCTLWRIRATSVERGKSIDATNRDPCWSAATWRRDVAGLTAGARLQTTNGRVPDVWW